MKGPNENPLWEAVQRGQRLTERQREELDASLAGQPGLRPQLDEDLALNQAMDRLPDAPVSSNFTAQVLQAVEREHLRQQREAVRPWWAEIFSLRWGRRLAFAGLVLAAALLIVNQQHRQAAREELARQFKGLEGVPSVEALQDFEAIRRLAGDSASPDEELLDALANKSNE